jgi:hypothetical protein
MISAVALPLFISKDSWLEEDYSFLSGGQSKAQAEIMCFSESYPSRYLGLT